MSDRRAERKRKARKAKRRAKRAALGLTPALTLRVSDWPEPRGAWDLWREVTRELAEGGKDAGKKKGR